MAEKPTYKELEKRIKGLEKEITECKQGVKLLKKSEENFRNMINQMSDMVFQAVTHQDGSFSIPFINDCINELSGYKPEEIMKDESLLYKPIHPEDLNHLQEHIAKSIKSRNEMSIEHRIINPDNEIKWYFMKAKPQSMDSGDLLWNAISMDITERKEAEEALRESELKYRTIFEGSTLGIIISDFKSKRFIDANESICQMFGYSKKELLDLSVKHLHPEEVMNQVTKDIKRQAQNKKTISYSIPCLKKDSSIFYADIAGATIKVDGKTCTVGFFKDITERKKMEETLKISHDKLEQRVNERTNELQKINKELSEKTNSLQEVNTALKVLLGKRDSDREEMGEKVLLNVKELLIPYINKLKNSNLSKSQTNYLDIIKSGLDEIISPFAKRLTSRYMHITPRELQVANLVKKGHTSKEIAEVLKCTERTIIAHRVNLREKLGLNKKSNLRTHLLSLQE